MIAQQVIEQVAERLRGSTDVPGTVEQLKTQYAEIRFTHCSEDDIHAGKPVAQTSEALLYLVDSSEHCLGLTTDPDQASGIVVAEVYGDDE